MIYTVTCNPSLDYIVDVPGFRLGVTNRTTAEMLMPGGKGINVSMVLQNLGIENTALGFAAGFVGDEICRNLEEIGCKTSFIRLENGISRINVKLRSADGTEINAKGPTIPEDALQKLMLQLDTLQSGDILVLAGSIPTGMPMTLYQDIMERLSKKDVLIVVDATGDLLCHVLPYHPFLIKPNHHELGEIFGVTIETEEQIEKYAKRLQEQGARNVLVSMGGKGAALLAEDGMFYRLPAPKGTLVNSVGAGDSMVAGFLTGWLETKDYKHAFRFSVATGSASAFQDGLAKRADAEALYQTLHLE